MPSASVTDEETRPGGKTFLASKGEDLGQQSAGGVCSPRLIAPGPSALPGPDVNLDDVAIRLFNGKCGEMAILDSSLLSFLQLGVGRTLEKDKSRMLLLDGFSDNLTECSIALYGLLCLLDMF